MGEAEVEARRRAADRTAAYDEVLELLDVEIAKFKERGDLATAEIIEVMRAKVRAKRDSK